MPSAVPDSQIGEIIDAYIEGHKDTTAGVSIAVPYVIASIILGLIPFVYAILFFKNRNKLSCSKRQKVSYVISMCMGFIMTFTVLVLELYRL